MTSRIVFGKEAKDLSIAEQFVLASAVNKPIILLEGSERLNAVRLDRWHYITEVRARSAPTGCWPTRRRRRRSISSSSASPAVRPIRASSPRLQEALEQLRPAGGQARAGQPRRPRQRADAGRALRTARGDEAAFGDGWREHVRGVTSTFDAVENLAFDRALEAALPALDRALQARIDSGYTLDPARIDATRQMPHVVVVAANHKGEIVRYYENYQNTPYYGSAHAVDRDTGVYDATREGRMLASTAR